MSVETRKTSQFWYGRQRVGGKKIFIKLGVKVRGHRPAAHGQPGDEEYEASRREAMIAYERLTRDVRQDHDADYHRKMYELLAQRPIRPEALPIAKAYEAWMSVPHARTRSERYLERVRAALAEYADFVLGTAAELDLGATTPEVAAAWAAHPGRKRGAPGAEKPPAGMASVAPGTFNSRLVLVRSVFEALLVRAGLPANPFAGIPLRHDEPVHRRPFEPAEVDAVIEAADPVIRGPMVTAACTAMRLGDCCLLKWSDVDLPAGFLSVRTAKTGERVEIPIFPRLRVALEKARRKGRGARGGEDEGPLERQDAAYVWPAAALMYRSNRAGLSYRTRKAIQAAGLVRFVPRAGTAVKHNASALDFHAFRTTWITMALSAGVPMELVWRVTGHRTVEVVQRHYFRPGRAEFAAALEKGLTRIVGAGRKG